MNGESRRAAAMRLRDAFVAEKGELWLRFQGRSMAPMLHEGDLLRVRCGAPPACGAVVAFQQRDATIVHRFLYRRRAGAALRTKGDNRWRFDRPLRPEQLIGTVCEIRRGAVRIDLDRPDWRRLAVGIAVASMLEGIVCACAAAVLRVLPQRLVARLGGARVREAVGGYRRAATAQLLRTMSSGSFARQSGRVGFRSRVSGPGLGNMAGNTQPETGDQKPGTADAELAGKAPPRNETRAVTAAEYFEAVQSAYEDAERRAGGAVERVFRVARHVMRLRFAGPALVSAATAAFEHLPPSADRVDFSVSLFDSASTGTNLPATPWSNAPHDVRGDVPALCDDRFVVSYLRWNGVLGLLDRARRRALFWIRAAADFPMNEHGSPLLMGLQGWLGSHGLQLVHAGAVGHASGGLLLAGRGGAGKSTTAVACLVAGLSYVADDYCVLAPSSRLEVHSLYNSAKLHTAGLYRFPQLSVGDACRIGDEKALFFLHSLYPERLAASLPIRAVALPVVHDGADSSVEPLSRMEAVRAVASSTIAQVPGADGTVLTATAAFVRQLPCYRLRVGSDMDRIAACVDRLVRSHGA